MSDWDAETHPGFSTNCLEHLTDTQAAAVLVYIDWLNKGPDVDTARELLSDRYETHIAPTQKPVYLIFVADYHVKKYWLFETKKIKTRELGIGLDRYVRELTIQRYGLINPVIHRVNP